MSFKENINDRVRVVSISESFSDNLGDQLIAECALKLLSSRFTMVDSWDYTLRKHRHGETTIKRVTTWRKALKFIGKRLPNSFHICVRCCTSFPKVFQIASKKYDYAFIGGGQLILSNKVFPASAFIWTSLFRFFGTKIIFLGIGAGKEYTRLEHFLFSRSLKSASAIYVRDRSSREVLDRIFGVSSCLIPDLAYIHKPERHEASLDLRKTIIFPVPYEVFSRYKREGDFQFRSEDEYHEFWLRMGRKYVSEGCSVYFSGSTLDDLMYCRKLLSRSDVDQSDLHIIDLRTLHDLTVTISSSMTIVSARMHVLIYAHLVGKEVKPVVLSSKLAVFSKEYLSRSSSDLSDEIFLAFKQLCQNLDI